MKGRNLLTPDNSVICLDLNSPRVKNETMLNSPSRFRFRNRAIVNAGTDEPSTANDGGRRRMGSSDERWPPRRAKPDAPKRDWRRVRHSPWFWVGVSMFLVAILTHVFSEDLSYAPASAAIGSERRRQFPGRSFEPLARALGHPRSYRARTAGCLRVKDLLIGVPNYWRYWSSGIGKSRRTRRITTQTKPGGLPKRFARALDMSRRLSAFTRPTIRSSQPERPVFRAPSQPPVNPALSSPTTR